MGKKKEKDEESVLVEFDGTVTPELNISGTVSVPKEIFEQGEDAIADHINDQLCYRVSTMFGTPKQFKDGELDIDFLQADLSLDRAEEVDAEKEEVEA